MGHYMPKKKDILKDRVLYAQKINAKDGGILHPKKKYYRVLYAQKKNAKDGGILHPKKIYYKVGHYMPKKNR